MSDEIYEVVLRVVRLPGQSHPGQWSWDELVGDPVEIVGVKRVEQTIDNPPSIE